MSFYHSPKVITNGLILYLDAANNKSYPGSGAIWYDLVGRHQFTISGPDFVAGNDAHFSFLDNQVDQIYNSNCTFMGGTTTMTVSCWVRLDSIATGQSLISYAHSTSYNEYLMFYEGAQSPKAWALWWDNTSISPLIDHTVTASQWYNFVHIANGTNHSFYANGIYIGASTTAAASLGSGGWMVFGQEQDSLGGGFQNTQELIGDLSVVQMYNRAFSVTEVVQNFNALRSRYGV